MHSQFRENSCFTYPAAPTRWLCGRFKIFHCLLDKSLPQTFYKKKDSAIPIAEPFNYCIIKMRFYGE